MNRRGFTLIELLVVISIIGLLSSIVMASIRDARQKAEYRATQQGLRSVTNALELYKSEHGSYPPANSAAGADLTSIRSTYLSSYLSDIPKLPNSLSSYSIKYLSNPYYPVPTTKLEWGCNSNGNYTNGYIIFLVGVTSPPSDMANYFPQTVRRRTTTSVTSTESNITTSYCLIDTVN